jgi:hypothetical protein
VPIRLFPKIKSDESVFKAVFKQLVLFLVKKAHESYYPVDYLGLLISLVKRIPPNETLYNYFHSLCEKPVRLLIYKLSAFSDPVQT